MEEAASVVEEECVVAAEVAAEVVADMAADGIDCCPIHGPSIFG